MTVSLVCPLYLDLLHFQGFENVAVNEDAGTPASNVAFTETPSYSPGASQPPVFTMPLYHEPGTPSGSCTRTSGIPPHLWWPVLRSTRYHARPDESRSQWLDAFVMQAQHPQAGCSGKVITSEAFSVPRLLSIIITFPPPRMLPDFIFQEILDW